MPDEDANRNEAPAGLWQRVRVVLADLGPAAPLFVLSCVGPIVGLVVLIATASSWLPWFDTGMSSVVTFWVVGAGLAAACLLPTHATSLVAGYLFGTALGSLVAWLVVFLAAAIGFVIWHRLVGERAVQAIARSPRALVVHRALLGRGYWRTTWLITLLRLSPVLPFAATNLLMASFGVRAAVFLSATVVGITPRAIAVAWIGSELSELDLRAGGNRWTALMAIVATVIAVFVVGRAARAALRRETAGLEDRAP